MIAGGGLGEVNPEDVGPVEIQAPNGVLDLVVEDEEEAVAATRRLLGYLRGPVEEWSAPDQAALRDAVPESSRRAYDVLPIVRTIADEESVTVLRESFAPELLTALLRIEGRPVGVIANNCKHQAGVVTGEAADKATHFMQLCDSFGIPVVSLIDTPGYMVGPEAERDALVRHCCRMLIAGAALTVPTLAVILRRGYGLGAQAMAFGSLHEPLLTAAWPDATLGPMGLEGAVRLAMRRDLDAIEDDGERERRVRELTAQMYEHAKALNAAQIFEIDDVIDPAETRATIARTLAASGTPTPSGRTVDPW
jgi:acetyl-CoA carboxylase carboxyltransferase component